MAITKAKIVPQFSYIPLGIIPGGNLECQFNPETITLSKKVNYGGKPDPSRDYPRTEYGGGSAATYSVDLYFDAYSFDDKNNPVDVRKKTNYLISLSLRTMGYMVPGVVIPYVCEPPSVYLVWGNFCMFRAVLTAVSVTYLIFSSEGIPIRAKAHCDFMEQSHPLDFLPPQNPSSRSEPRQTYRVIQGDRIDNVANQVYGDPRRWRAIAQENDLEDPFNLSGGSLLTVPQID